MAIKMHNLRGRTLKSPLMTRDLVIYGQIMNRLSDRDMPRPSPKPLGEFPVGKNLLHVKVQDNLIL